MTMRVQGRGHIAQGMGRGSVTRATGKGAKLLAGRVGRHGPHHTMYNPRSRLASAVSRARVVSGARVSARYRCACCGLSMRLDRTFEARSEHREWGRRQDAGYRGVRRRAMQCPITNVSKTKIVVGYRYQVGCKRKVRRALLATPRFWRCGRRRRATRDATRDGAEDGDRDAPHRPTRLVMDYGLP